MIQLAFRICKGMIRFVIFPVNPQPCNVLRIFLKIEERLVKPYSTIAKNPHHSPSKLLVELEHTTCMSVTFFFIVTNNPTSFKSIWCSPEALRIGGGTVDDKHLNEIDNDVGDLESLITQASCLYTSSVNSLILVNSTYKCWESSQPRSSTENMWHENADIFLQPLLNYLCTSSRHQEVAPLLPSTQ